MVDWGGIVGLNYRIDVTMTTAEDISDAVLTPEDAAELNNRPIAVAGNDQEVEGNLVTLDASGSSDPDGNLLTYAWFMEEDDEPFSTSVSPTIHLSSGYHEIGLRVSDGELQLKNSNVKLRMYADFEICFGYHFTLIMSPLNLRLSNIQLSQRIVIIFVPYSLSAYATL